MIFSHIIEEKNNIKIEILEEAKFMIEHDFQMMNPGSHVTSCFWWLVQALDQSLLSICRKLGCNPLSAQQRLGSGLADAHADLSLR